MKRQNRKMKSICAMLSGELGAERTRSILPLANQFLAEMIAEHQADPHAVKVHTEQDIFPCISWYQALQEDGIPKEEAFRLLDEIWSRCAQNGADRMKKLLKAGNLYRRYPSLFQRVAKCRFGTAAGFQARFYDCGPQHCKFDMTECLFLTTCRTYGCPELTLCFCHTDDINNADLHPKLCWNRTQSMGAGAEFCDFDLFVRDPLPSDVPSEEIASQLGRSGDSGTSAPGKGTENR